LSWLELLLIPLGFVVGAFGTLVGAGGGFVLVPLLLLIYPDEDPAQITAISLAVVFFNALSGSAAYARLKRIDYQTGLIFAAATIPGAVAGAYLVGEVPRRLFDVMFGLLLISLALYTLWGAGRQEMIRTPMRGRGVITRTMPAGESETFMYSFNVWLGALYSTVVGLISSLLGIGGGVIHVPIMITFLRFPTHIAVATSHFVLAFMAGAGSGVHLANGDLAGDNMIRAVLIAIGVIPGAQLGARVAQRLHGRVIARLLVVALLVLSVRLLYSGLTG
jgi:uncharacterized membrane protein YfcA